MDRATGETRGDDQEGLRKALTIRQRTLIRAPAEAIFPKLTTAAGLDAWFTRGACLDQRPGGEIVFRWENFGADRVTLSDPGQVLELEPSRRFAFTWGAVWPTRVDLVLEPDPEGTVVTVTEEGWPPDLDGVRGCLENATGWGEALTLLKFHCEHGLTY